MLLRELSQQIFASIKDAPEINIEVIDNAIAESHISVKVEGELNPTVANLCSYIADYINEEIEYDNLVTPLMIYNAIDAFSGGACDGCPYTVRLKRKPKIHLFGKVEHTIYQCATYDFEPAQTIIDKCAAVGVHVGIRDIIELHTVGALLWGLRRDQNPHFFYRRNPHVAVIQEQST